MSVLGTDLALEAAQAQLKTIRLPSQPGLTVRRRVRDGYALTAMDLTGPQQAEKLKRPTGKYITMELTPYLQRQQDFFARGARCIARELAALLLVLVLLGSMAYFTVSVLHLITQLAVNSACDLMQLKINAAVTAAQAQVQGDYYTYRTDADGTITAVSIDTEHVGQVSSLVLEHMMDGDDGQVELDIPLETLFGVNFLPGLKLPLPVRVLVLTTSDVSYHNELVSAAINQSKYQLYLNVKMDLDILVPWEHQTETVGTNVLLAETVIVGKVPQTYVEVE